MPAFFAAPVTPVQEAQVAVGLEHAGHALDWILLGLFVGATALWFWRTRPGLTLRLAGRLLHPENRRDGRRFDSIATAADELVDALRLHRQAHPNTRFWLLTNFPNWGFRGEVSYHARGPRRQDYGDYDEVVRVVLRKLQAAGIPLAGVTVDNPYDYLTGEHRSVNLQEPKSVNWLQRVRAYEDFARERGLEFNLIVNSERGGHESDERCCRETLAMVDLYRQATGWPTRWFVQSWYPYPKQIVPEAAPYSLTALVKAVIERVGSTPTIQPSDPAPAATGERVDVEMTVRNHTEFLWHDVFAFNCLNPVQAPAFQDWKLERTYMSRQGKPFAMAGTTRVKGHMPTVGFYLPEHTKPGTESVFVRGFGATSPDRTDASWILTLSEPPGTYMAATAIEAGFLFDNLDRCCIHAAPGFGDIGPGESSTTVSRLYLAGGTLDSFLARFGADRPGLVARQKWARPR